MLKSENIVYLQLYYGILQLPSKYTTDALRKCYENAAAVLQDCRLHITTHIYLNLLYIYSNEIRSV